MNHPQTRIVATIGPATQSEKMMSSLYTSGVRFFRMNMSHGDHATHTKTITLRNSVEKKTGGIIGSICDLCGPKIRLGDFASEEITLESGQLFLLTTRPHPGDATGAHITHKTIAQDVAVGNTILLDDGKRALKVTRIINETDVETKVMFGGTIKSRRGVNIPDANLSISALTAKDMADITWGISQNVDYFAISFVRTEKDIIALRKILTTQGSSAKIIAKIETPQAVANIDAIIAATDAIMIARGDLAVEVGAENVPYIQKDIIARCGNAGKPVITATQMLESMVRTQVPTRAEISDVANAVLDGTDALMLSEETAVGQFPIECVDIMAKTARMAEGMTHTHRRIAVTQGSLTASVSSSIVHIAEDINARCIVALTESGATARLISRHRPKQAIFAFTPHLATARQVLLSSGVTPVLTKTFKNITSAVTAAEAQLKKSNSVQKNDSIVISAGMPFGKSGSTNTLMVYTIGR